MLPRHYGDKAETHLRAYPNHGSDREPLPRNALQTRLRRWMQIAPPCRDERQEAPNRREGGRKACEQIGLRMIHPTSRLETSEVSESKQLSLAVQSSLSDIGGGLYPAPP